jgi:hypothetical protein
MLRCKENELAVISYTPVEMADFHGLFVTTLRLAADGDFGLSHNPTKSKHDPYWIVSFQSGRRPKYLKHNDYMPSTLGVWPDKWLRPIRDDGSLFDETMFWPVKHHARA